MRPQRVANRPTPILICLLGLVLWLDTASSLELLMPPLQDSLVRNTSDQLTLMINSLDCEHQSIYNLVRLLTYEHFDLSMVYRPDEEMLQKIIEFLRQENLSFLAKYLLPIEMLSPTYHGRDWMKLLKSSSEEYRNILRSVRLGKSKWRPRDWPLSDRLLLLEQLIQEQRSSLDEPLSIVDLVLGKGEWSKIVQVPDIYYLFGLRSVSLHDPSSILEELTGELGQLVDADDLVLLHLGSYRLIRRQSRACHEMINSIVSGEVNPFRLALLQLTDPTEQNQNILLKTFEKAKGDLWLKLVGVQLVAGTSYWRLCSFLISVLDVALLRRISIKLINRELLRVLERCGPNDVIPFQLRPLMVNLSADHVKKINSLEWQKVFNEPTGIKLYLHRSLHPLSVILNSWRHAYLSFTRSRSQVFAGPLDEIFNAMEHFRTLFVNIIWQRNAHTISLTQYLISKAEKMLDKGRLTRIDKKSGILRIDCTRSPSSYRPFWFGLLLRLALYETPMLLPDSSALTTDSGASFLEIRDNLCTEPSASSVSAVEGHWRLITDFLDLWALSGSFYNLL